MATASLATDETRDAQYQLSEDARQQLVLRPDVSIPTKKLEIVERQRRRFIQRFGSDGLSEPTATVLQQKSQGGSRATRSR